MKLAGHLACQLRGRGEQALWRGQIAAPRPACQCARKAAGRACGAVTFLEVGNMVVVSVTWMVTCLLCLTSNGGVVGFCIKRFIWGCMQQAFSGVVGFSFSGLCPLASCLNEAFEGRLPRSRKKNGRWQVVLTGLRGMNGRASTISQFCKTLQFEQMIYQSSASLTTVQGR